MPKEMLDNTDTARSAVFKMGAMMDQCQTTKYLSGQSLLLELCHFFIELSLPPQRRLCFSWAALVVKYGSDLADSKTTLLPIHSGLTKEKSKSSEWVLLD